MKDSKIFIGIDIGTSVTKGIAMNSKGKIVADAAINRDVKRDNDLAEVWWDEVYIILKSLLQDIEIRNHLYSITISGMVPNIIMLDNKGNIVAKTRLFYEDFALEIEKELDKLDGTKWMNEYISKLIYLSQYEKTWGSVKHILTSHTYCIYKLTGNYVCDYGTAFECGHAFDINKRNWNLDKLKEYKIGNNLLPKIVTPLSVVGNLSLKWEEEFGVSNVKIIAGTHDSVASIIGAGLSKKEDALIYYGTYNCSAFLKEDIIKLLDGSSEVNPICWTASIPRSGQQLSTIVQLLCGKDKFDEFSILASDSIPGANDVLFIQNPDLLSTGISSEPNGMFLNIRTSTKKEDLCRAVFESFGYGIKSFWKYEHIKKPKVCYVAGGGIRSKEWLQIVSDIIQIDQILYERTENAVGTAMIGICSYDYELYNQINEIRADKKTIIHHAKNNEHYKKQLEKYYNILINKKT